MYAGDIEELPKRCDDDDCSTEAKGNNKDETFPAVICPWHGWAFFLQDGQCESISMLKVETFPTKVEDDHLYVQMTITEETDF